MDEKKVKEILEVSKQINSIDEQIQTLKANREELSHRLCGLAYGKVTAVPASPKVLNEVPAKAKPKPKGKGPTYNVKDGSWRAKIATAMKPTPNVVFTTQDVYQILEADDEDTRGVIRATLNRMCHAGQLYRPSKGKYIYEKRGATANGEDWISLKILKVMRLNKEMSTSEIIAKLKVRGKTKHWLQNKVWTMGRDGIIECVRRGTYKRTKKLQAGK